MKVGDLVLFTGRMNQRNNKRERHTGIIVDIKKRTKSSNANRNYPDTMLLVINYGGEAKVITGLQQEWEVINESR